ncbi:MAG: lysylphosphatidylglycerol synthase transmembrane domain-containing protein [Steroidobacteraceae bacterium]
MQPAEIAEAVARQAPRSRNTRLLVAAKVVISFGLLFALFHYADMSRVVRRLAKADVLILFLSFLLLIAQGVISSFKWRLILRSDGLAVPFWTLFRVNATGSFVSLFLPSSFGGDIYRVAALRTVAGGLVRSGASVVFDRGSGLFALVTISAISYQFYPHARHGWIVIFGWVLAILLFVAATSRPVLESGFWPSWPVAQHFRSFLSTLRNYRNSGGVFARVAALSLVFQLIMVVVNKLYAEALGIEIAFSTLLVIIPLIYLTEAIPLGINGIGIRDSAFVIAFAAIGRSAEQALAMSLLLISMRYLYGFSCGLCVLMAYFIRRHWPHRKTAGP